MRRVTGAPGDRPWIPGQNGFAHQVQGPNGVMYGMPASDLRIVGRRRAKVLRRRGVFVMPMPTLVPGRARYLYGRL